MWKITWSLLNQSTKSIGSSIRTLEKNQSCLIKLLNQLRILQTIFSLRRANVQYCSWRNIRSSFFKFLMVKVSQESLRRLLFCFYWIMIRFQECTWSSPIYFALHLLIYFALRWFIHYLRYIILCDFILLPHHSTYRNGLFIERKICSAVFELSNLVQFHINFLCLCILCFV